MGTSPVSSWLPSLLYNDGIILSHLFLSPVRMAAIAIVCILILICGMNEVVLATPALTQQQEQVLFDRLFQTNLRGPRWSEFCYLYSGLLTPNTWLTAGNDNQNTLTDLVSTSMKIAGLSVKNLNYTLNRSFTSILYFPLYRRSLQVGS
jgi:hypothetical protein